MFLRRLVRPSLRSFSTSKETVVNAVRSFVQHRKHEIASELTQKGSLASDQDKKAATDSLAKLSAEVHENSKWSELGFDGLDEVECILTIEDALGVRLPDEEFHMIHSVPDAINIVSKHLASKQASA